MLQDQNFIVDFSTENDIITTIISNSYDELKSFQDLVQFQNSEIDINFNNGISNETWTFNVKTFPYLLVEIVYNYINSLSSNAKFFMENLNTFSELGSLTIDAYLDDLDSYDNSFSVFYLSLTLICFFLVITIQSISFPLIKHHGIYLERILNILTRLKEKECRLELLKLKATLKRMESQDESYMIYDFKELEDLKNSDESTKDTDTKKQNKSNASYISNKIHNNKITNKFSFLFFLISLLTIGIYYTIIFSLKEKFQQTIDNSLSLFKYTESYYVCIHQMDLFRMIILINKQTNTPFIINDNNNEILDELNSCISVLKEKNEDSLPNILSDFLGGSFSNYDNLLSQNLCDSFQDDCDQSLYFGIQGYSSHLINLILQSGLIFSNATILDIETINQNIFLEGDFNKTLYSYNVLMKSLDNLLTENLNIENNLLDGLSFEILAVFLIGGLGSSLFLFIINILRYKFMRNEFLLTKEMLCLIPLANLQDEGTLYMLKNL